MACMALFWTLDVPLRRYTRRWSLRDDEEGMQEAWCWSNVAERLVRETVIYIAPLALFDLAFPRRHLVRSLRHLVRSLLCCHGLNGLGLA